jgi:hypothetical protein
MIFKIKVAVFCVLAASGVAQTDSPKPVHEPSPMERFARESGSHITWASEVGRMEHGPVRAVVTAVVIEKSLEPARKIRGVKIDLVGGEANDGTGAKASDEIYLDEEAAMRTTTGLKEIADGVERFGGPHGANGCEGSLIFVVKFQDHEHPWSKYHELDAAYCGMPDGPGLLLTGRGKPAAFRIPGETPEHFRAMLEAALNRARER